MVIADNDGSSSPERAGVEIYDGVEWKTLTSIHDNVKNPQVVFYKDKIIVTGKLKLSTISEG